MLPQARKIGYDIPDNIRINKDGSLFLTDGGSVQEYLKEWYRVTQETVKEPMHEDGSITIQLMSKRNQERIESLAVMPHCA